MTSKKYKRKVKNRILLQNLLIVICLVAIAVYLYIKLRPEHIVLQAVDECGPMSGNMISHTINDEGECANACRATCLSYEYDFRDSEFTMKGLECNECTCTCLK